MHSVHSTVGASYLLVLRHEASSPLDIFSTSEGMNIQVKGRQLYPSEEARPLVVAGESLADFKKKISNLAQQHPCL
jgi:hypothetical protein